MNSSSSESTESSRTDIALRESEERYRSLVQNTTAVILRVSPGGVIVFANNRALEFLGYSAEELIGNHAVGTIIPERETTAAGDLAAMVADIAKDPNRFHSNANENMRKNGERVWVEWTNSGIYDADGSLKEFLSVGIDATARKAAEEALRARNAELAGFNDLMVGRELRMIELKKEINDLCRQSGRPDRYEEDRQETT